MSLEPSDSTLDIAQHAVHVRFSYHPVGDVHHDVSLSCQMAEEAACHDVLIKGLPCAAMEVDDAQPRPRDAWRRLPEVAEKRPAGAALIRSGDGGKGQVAGHARTAMCMRRQFGALERPCALAGIGAAGLVGQCGGIGVRADLPDESQS